MIISNQHRFIFIHCRKTGGSSVVVALARHLGPSDLQLSAIEETVENGIQLTERVRAEALAESRLVLPFLRLVGAKQPASLTAKYIKRAYARRLGEKPQHPSAAAIAKAFPKEWQSYTKFCVVRNPWEKTVSDYFWRTRDLRSPPGFKDYVQALSAGASLSGIVPKQHSNWEMYTIDDQVVVDHVIRYENLKDDLNEVCRSLGIASDGWLPNAKARRSTAEGPKPKYQEFYDRDLIERVRELYRNEIERFAYSFEEP